MKRSFFKFHLFMGTFVLLGGCQKTQDQFAALQGCLQSSFSSSSTEGQVIASVDGIDITEGEWNERIAKLPLNASQMFLTSKKGKENFLNLIISEKVLARMAQKAGIEQQQNLALRLRLAEHSVLADATRSAFIRELHGTTDPLVKDFYAKPTAENLERIQRQKEYIRSKVEAAKPSMHIVIRSDMISSLPPPSEAQK